MPTLGAPYYDTTVGAWFVYSGTAWQKASTSNGGNSLVTKTASYLVTAADAGKIIVASLVTSMVVTLPDGTANPGLEVTVLNGLATTSGIGTSVALTTAGDIIIGDGITPGAGKAFINTEATNKIGDLVTLQSDGAGNWYITKVIGTWARAA